jgi:hypothetical protein
MNGSKSRFEGGARQRKIAIDVTSAAVAASDLAIDDRAVYRRLGYTERKKPRPAIASMLSGALHEALEMLQPTFWCKTVDIEHIRRPRVTLSSDIAFTLTSDVLCRALAPCQQAVCFICSIGPRLEDRVAVLMGRGETLRASILDAVGSEAAERIADYVEAMVKREAESVGANVTLRYSPGYCDWDITQQRILFKVFDSDAVSVSLTEECLMIPQKSVSAIVGVGWGDRRLIAISPCRPCEKKGDCDHRR